ncbi:putative isomerase YddE [Candidatus Izimaplasma bacterium HR1]|jgi:PhzF family phenazine biosynthesis protein|uniref:PhzF family phenazine biosynthesis protein n=1 Tax=Candidatus Izimoplasma sp. HR1 TaxID=1541959 RepID=UPI0004F8B875|nr:putative isomerase YddE [Candidatus Izimaplasma bacterium HR1]
MSLYLLTAFPKTEYGGNKAGVYLDADNLTEKEMKKIAKDVGFSETAFVMKSDVADFRVRFFTPTNEVDLCGHATIATFNLLRDLKVIEVGTYTQETKAGVLKLIIKKDEVFMEQVLPEFYEELSYSDISTCFSNSHYTNDDLPIQIVSTGIKEIFLPVKDTKTLNKLKPNFEEIIEVSIRHNVIGIHAFTLAEDCDAYGRNFAPVVGIKEESATGTSNGALGCYIYKHANKKEKYVLRQGYAMDLPSEIITKLEIKDNEIKKVLVGGSARIIKE